MRTGKEYLDALSDGRTVYVNGERVEDVAAHPAFSGVARSVARLYDFAADPANGMTYPAAETGGPALKPFMIPRSAADLVARREAITKWAELTHGWVGRAPDHVANFFAGFASNAEVFDRDTHQLSGSVRRWYRRLLDESLFLSYVIIPPQVSRITTAHDWPDDYIQVGVVEERDDGVVIRGSQMLGTSASVSDHVFVSCIKPLTPEDVDYAISLVVPVNARGLKLYCRRPYALGQPSAYDYPLSTRFDETDALLVFDDVFVPWEDVFVSRDVAGVRAQFFETPAHVLGNHQAQIRFVTKLKFVLGVTRKICAVNQIDRIPGVVEKLGELASLAAMVEACMLAAESNAVTNAQGVTHPHPRFLYGAMGLQSELYPRVLQTLRELVGGGVLQVPSSREELLREETGADIRRYIRSPEVPAEERIKLFKLAWDVVGSEFGGRHHQYEMFYAGAPFVAKGYAFRNYDFSEAVAGVDDFLASYNITDDA